MYQRQIEFIFSKHLKYSFFFLVKFTAFGIISCFFNKLLYTQNLGISVIRSNVPKKSSHFLQVSTHTSFPCYHVIQVKNQSKNKNIETETIKI